MPPRVAFKNKVELAIEKMARANDETRGAFYTKKEVVQFMLDLIGYRSDEDLSSVKLLDPCFGEGVFIIEAVDRLLKSAQTNRKVNVSKLKNSIRGVEISEDSFIRTREKLGILLQGAGFSKQEINKLLSHWLIQGDFLLSKFEFKFDYIVGNPPYLRLEKVDKALLGEYRKLFQTIDNRADLYIAFFEKALDLLGPSGMLSYICADRWLKNKYGNGLRKFIQSNFNLEYVLNLHNADPFESKVAAYPSIFLIRKNDHNQTIYRELNRISSKIFEKELQTAKDLFEKSKTKIIKHTISFDNAEWLVGASGLRPLFEFLNNNYPVFKDAGIKIGIGVATGSDKIFILSEEDKNKIEEDRLLKLILREDLKNEKIFWSGNYLINTFEKDGSIINLPDYPKLKKYFEDAKESLVKRHVAQERHDQWFRTIDKPILSLLKKPRLYIPDIMLNPEIVYSTENYYPHHNLYWATSDEWDLRALKTVLKSAIAFLYIDTFSTRVRGGYYRYQAQILKKIRIPRWSDLNQTQHNILIALADSQDFYRIDSVVSDIYKLPGNQRDFLSKKNEQHGLRLSRLREIGERRSRAFLEHPKWK